jgi:hypothetical protein
MMNETEMAQYLNENYGEHFTKKVTPHDIKRWAGQERITEFTESGLDNSMRTNKIPPKRGRPRIIPQANMDDALAAIEAGMSQSKAATMYGISASMLSRVRRNERRRKDANIAFNMMRYGIPLDVEV